MSKPTHSPAVPKVPWNPWSGTVFVILVFLASQFFAVLLVSIWYLFLKHVLGLSVPADLNNSTFAQFLFVLVTETLSVGSIYWFLRIRNLGLGQIGLKKPRWIDAGYALAAVVPYYILFLLTVGVASTFDRSLNVNQAQELGFDSVHGALALTITFLSLVVLPPLAEEVMVRGFLYSSLKKALPTISAAVVASALFALPHLFESGSGGLLYIAGLDTFVLSVVLIYLREKTGSLWASIGLHAIKNGVAFCSLFVFNAK